MVEAYIALGSNVGDREGNINKAFEILKQKLKIVKTSSLYETKPMYLEKQGWFLNGAAKVNTELTPKELLDFLKSIEKKLGRKNVERNGPRIIDLDILFYGDQILNDDDLHIPHPKIQERAFVLVPLAEIEPNLIHPIYNKTIKKLLSELNYNRSEIRPKNKHDLGDKDAKKIKVYVKTPARLHLGLIDLNSELGRMFGGLGVAINHPNVILEAQKSQTLTVKGEKIELTQNIATRFLEAFAIKEKVAIDVKQVIPEHVGLGSGTQLALAVATSISLLFNIKNSINELAAIMGRTAQSGVGTGVFAQGGLVVEAGKNTQDPNQKIIPLICRQPIPNEWRFVVAIPNTKKGLANEAETLAFKKLPPMPAEEVGKICRLIMMKLLPGIIENNIENFGEALTQIQNIVGDSFAQAQGGRYSSSTAAQCIEFMLKNGVYGSGQSSWGPAIYGVVKNSEAEKVQAKIQTFLDRSVGGNVFVAKANNRGAIVRVIK